jgi:cytochrome c556
MLRLIAAGVGGVVLTIILASANTSAEAADKKDVPNIEDIMKIVNKPKGLHKAVGKALEADPVAWSDVSTKMKQYAELADALGKNPCPKGNGDSWSKLCKAYAVDAKALETAVAKKDKAAATTAWSKLNKSCQGCHDEHR